MAGRLSSTASSVANGNLLLFVWSPWCRRDLQASSTPRNKSRRRLVCRCLSLFGRICFGYDSSLQNTWTPLWHGSPTIFQYLPPPPPPPLKNLSWRLRTICFLYLHRNKNNIPQSAGLQNSTSLLHSPPPLNALMFRLARTTKGSDCLKDCVLFFSCTFDSGPVLSGFVHHLGGEPTLPRELQTIWKRIQSKCKDSFCSSRTRGSCVYPLRHWK